MWFPILAYGFNVNGEQLESLRILNPKSVSIFAVDDQGSDDEPIAFVCDTVSVKYMDELGRDYSSVSNKKKKFEKDSSIHLLAKEIGEEEDCGWKYFTTSDYNIILDDCDYMDWNQELYEKFMCNTKNYVKIAKKSSKKK